MGIWRKKRYKNKISTRIARKKGFSQNFLRKPAKIRPIGVIRGERVSFSGEL